ncbi:MAG: SDR family oxidoreductase [Aquabacterium sp.]|nr:MAG: SDR family oxidoreductase [Aquabacterium sp.]
MHTPQPDRPAARRTVLVTGAARRLGRHIALHLAQAGWDIAVHCHRSRDDAQATADEARAHGARAEVLQADLASEGDCRGLLAQAVARLGPVDAVVNSASLFEFDDAQGFGHDAFSRHLLTNTAAPVLLAQALAAHLQSDPAREGVVVNLLDQKLWNPNPDFFSYTLSKAALEAATTLLAQALAPRLRVAGVAPGLTLDSPWLQGEQFRQAHQLSPLGRSSTPDDVAAAVRFVLENRSITGTTLVVDGGQHLMRFTRDFSMMNPG